MNSPELTQASDEPKIKAPSSSGYLHDQSPDDSRSRVSSEAHCIVWYLHWVGWECVSFGSESEFWSVLGCVFYLFGVKVTENIEVGYRALMVRITGGQSVKI